jgi:chromosome segregation and condensation protein ScpB
VAIERGEGGRKDVKYRTTDRFLQLFDLRDLGDLPEAEEIAFK